MGDDGRAFVDGRANAAEMIPMVVRGDDVADRLVRNHFLRFRDHRERALLGLRRVDQHDVILHLDGQAVMRAAGEVVDALGELRRVDANRRRRGAVRTLSGTVISTAGFAVTDATVKSRRETRPGSGRCARKLDAAEILVVAVDGFNQHVADDRLVDPGLDSLDLDSAR